MEAWSRCSAASGGASNSEIAYLFSGVGARCALSEGDVELEA